MGNGGFQDEIIWYGIYTVYEWLHFARAGLYPTKVYARLPGRSPAGRTLADPDGCRRCVCSAAMEEVHEPGDHGSTYGGNPMAGQACRTVFKILEETKMLDHVQDISEYLIEKLDDLKDKYSCIKERRGLGLMIGLEFDRPVKDIVQTCLDNGLIVVMAGANVIRMLPPFITTEKDVDQAIAILDQAIEKNI